MTDPSGRTVAEDWWQTAFIRMVPNQIDFRGRPIEELIGTIGFADMIWLCLRGDLPSKNFTVVFTQQKLRLTSRIYGGGIRHAS
jgi:citrate synthase